MSAPLERDIFTVLCTPLGDGPETHDTCSLSFPQVDTYRLIEEALTPKLPAPAWDDSTVACQVRRSLLRSRKERSLSVPAQLNELQHRADRGSQDHNQRLVLRPGDFGWGRWVSTDEMEAQQRESAGGEGVKAQEDAAVPCDEGSREYATTRLVGVSVSRELIWDIGCRVVYRAATFRPVVAFFIGIVLCVTNTHLPESVNTLLTTVGNANTFMVFILLGLFWVVFGVSLGA